MSGEKCGCVAIPRTLEQDDGFDAIVWDVDRSGCVEHSDEAIAALQSRPTAETIRMLCEAPIPGACVNALTEDYPESAEPILKLRERAERAEAENRRLKAANEIYRREWDYIASSPAEQFGGFKASLIDRAQMILASAQVEMEKP